MCRDSSFVCNFLVTNDTWHLSMDSLASTHSLFWRHFKAVIILNHMSLFTYSKLTRSLTNSSWGPCCQACWPELAPQDSHGGRKGLTLRNSPLASTHPQQAPTAQPTKLKKYYEYLLPFENLPLIFLTTLYQKHILKSLIMSFPLIVCTLWTLRNSF